VTVGLCMEGRTHQHLRAGYAEELLPKLTGEDGVTIIDDRFGQPMQFEDVFHKQLGDQISSVGVTHRNEVSLFAQSVDYCQDDILPLSNG
jgi:hypothetical protein